MAFHRVLEAAPPYGKPMWSRLPGYELRLGGMQPSFSPSGDPYAAADYVPSPVGGNTLSVVDGQQYRQPLFHEKERSVLGPQWSVKGDLIIFGIGHFGAFFNGFHDFFLEARLRGRWSADRDDQRRWLRLSRIDDWPENNGFPSMSPMPPASFIARLVPRRRVCAFSTS